MNDVSTRSDVEPAGSVVSAEEIRRNIDSDRDRAHEAVLKAEEELSTGQRYEFIPDITGNPTGALAHSNYVRDHLRGLEAVLRSPFYYRVNTVLSMSGASEPMQLLVSKARDTGGAVFGDDWMIVSWTSEIANRIQGKRPGETVEIERRQVSSYEVGESARYEELFPKALNASFFLNAGDAALASEDDLAAMVAEVAPLTRLPPQAYAAKPTFGLSDIIVLVDEPQRAALALPFGQSVIIEGPPGSGKTSIGIMRIAVLYDQQWQMLGLQRGKDRPFHDYGTMRVLVYNEEMVEYLRGLAQSIGVENARVETTKDYLRRICRTTRLLTGAERRDKSSLAVLKGRRETLRAYFAGFKQHVQNHWDQHRASLRLELSHLGSDFISLVDRLDQWVDRVKTADVVDGRIVGRIGIADSLTQAAEAIRIGRSPTRTSRKGSNESDSDQMQPVDLHAVDERLKTARRLVEDAVRGACSRVDMTIEMFRQPEYKELLSSLQSAGVPTKTIEDGDRLWRKQYKGDLPAYSELDLAMTAWLGAPLLLTSSTGGKPWIGGRLEHTTHLVIDEAQDLSPSHIAVLASQLSPNGTLTLVGDIHQNLNPHAGIQSWSEAGLEDAARSAFGVNHRQTQQLGGFLARLHKGLFDEECPWRPASKTSGGLPRVGIARTWNELASAIAIESSFWREMIQGETGPTVAVLYDGRVQPKRLKWLRSQLEIALSDRLIPVEVAMPGDGADVLRRTDRVLIASVRQTKGLEFDAVVFIEPRPRWAKPVDQIDLRVRNGLYVAASRGRAGLSVCMSNLPSFLPAIAASGFCEEVEWPTAKENLHES